MAVLHIYTKNGKIYCTAKEPFLGKEKPLPNLPAFSELFSSGVTCVVFKLPSLLKTRNFKLICFALLSFVLRKYYRQKIPKLLDSFLNKQKEKIRAGLHGRTDSKPRRVLETRPELRSEEKEVFGQRLDGRVNQETRRLLQP